MTDDNKLNKDSESKSVWEDLLPFIELGCMEAFNKSFKEVALMSESAGKKLLVEEVMSLAALGAKVSARKSSE